MKAPRFNITGEQDTAARADELVRRIGAVSGIAPPRSAVLKLALDRGLASLENDHVGAEHGGKEPAR